MNMNREKLPLTAYRPASIRYTFDSESNTFHHNFERDLHMFVLWERSKDQWGTIARSISDKFRVLGSFEIKWSEKNTDNNFLRLYGTPLPSSTDIFIGGRREKVGSGAFRLYVVEDSKPEYIYQQTFSGKVELVNRNIALAKSDYRKLAGGGINIHSSNSLREFFRDCALFLGVERLWDTIKGDQSGPEPVVLERDLTGSDGWSSQRELFDLLIIASDYVILRNHEDLLIHSAADAGDIDILARDPEDFAALICGKHFYADFGKYAYRTSIAGKDIPFDIRFVGDGYLDTQWENTILERSEVVEGRYSIPAPDDAFFSLTYHAKLHKTEISARYVDKLLGMAKCIGLDGITSADFVEDDRCAKLLGGFLAERGYYRCTPMDRWVPVNLKFATALSRHGLTWNRERLRDRQWLATTLARLPVVWRIRGRAFDFVLRVWSLLKRKLYRG